MAMNLKRKIELAFNAWMQDYIDNPAKSDGTEPTYGETCAAILERYMGCTISPLSQIVEASEPPYREYRDGSPNAMRQKADRDDAEKER